MLALTNGLACLPTGVSREAFNIEVNAKDYGFEPTDTPRTDRSVQTDDSLDWVFSFFLLFFLVWGGRGCCSIERVIQSMLILHSKHGSQTVLGTAWTCSLDNFFVHKAFLGDDSSSYL